MTSDLQNTYLYDAEGRICAVKEPPVAGVTMMVGYLYDAEGNRIGKGSIQQWNCNTDTNGFSLTNEYVLGRNGEQVTELDGNGGWLHTNAYAGGQMIATYDPQGLHYQISDWLGNRRVQTNSTGAVELTWQNLPFGELTPSSTLGATEHHFAGKERDSESGNDYMFARYYNSATGRFLSPDWSAKEEPVPYAKLDNPQTLNLYSYVGNNPVGRADADGHQQGAPESAEGGNGKDDYFEPELVARYREETALEPVEYAPPPPILPPPTPLQQAVQIIFHGGPVEQAIERNVDRELAVHGNSLNTTKVTTQYRLENRDTGQVLKYGETTRPNGQGRYSQPKLDEMNANLVPEAKGTKREMKALQTQKIRAHTAATGKRPPLNKTDQ